MFLSALLETKLRCGFWSVSSLLLDWDACALQLAVWVPCHPETSLLRLAGDFHGDFHGPYWSLPWSPVSRDLVVSVVSGLVRLETCRVPGRASAVGMGLQTPPGCMDQPCSRAASAAEASSRVPAAELVHTGTSGPRPHVSAKGVLGPGMGVQLAAAGEIRSCLSPSARCPCSGWWMLWWQRAFLGRWVGLDAGGFGPCPAVREVPVAGVRGPPSPAQHRVIRVSKRGCEKDCSEEGAGINSAALIGLYQ